MAPLWFLICRWRVAFLLAATGWLLIYVAIAGVSRVAHADEPRVTVQSLVSQNAHVLAVYERDLTRECFWISERDGGYFLSDWRCGRCVRVDGGQECRTR